MPSSRRSGFTLIELSIVLVIIGLLVGGVLVGKDLIEASKIRADVSLLQNITTATNAFKLKYNGLPGDMLWSDKNKFGLSMGGGCGQGTNGNGIIEGLNGLRQYPNYELAGGCEPGTFFTDLSQTGLFNGHFDSLANLIPNWAPPLKTHNNRYILPISTNIDTAIWYIAGLNETQQGNQDMTATLPTYTPKEAFSIDSKIDDGVPGTGNARAIKLAWPNSAIDTTAGACVVAVNAAAYNASVDTQQCTLMIRAF